MNYWWIVALGIIATPLLVYGLITVGSQAYFRVKREHTKSLLKELGGDIDKPKEQKSQCR